MKNQAEKAPIEAPLLAQLADVERRIVDLEGERAALQRLITKVRQQNLTAQDVTRKNSFDRILAENKILEILEKTEKFVSVRDLYRDISLIKSGIKDTTFRSYLHRLKARGLIEPSRITRGLWRLVRKPPP